MATTVQSITDICRAAKRASRQLAQTGAAIKTAALNEMADALIHNADAIIEANRHDVEAGHENGLNSALIDRLTLNPGGIRRIADGVRTIAALPDPVGEVIDGFRLPSGLDVRKVRVPLGVVAVVYESRPNVTIDAAALCLKSGNAVVLRGSSAAAHSNAILASIAAEAATKAGLPENAMSLVAGGGHGELRELATQTGVIDLIIPRGGEGLKAALKGVATVPVIFAASGNCHIYVDASADQHAARQIVVNAKVQRPGVCNAAETLLVHADIAAEFLPNTLHTLHDAGVVIHADVTTRELMPDLELRHATDRDWDSEYLALEIAVKVVSSTEEAIQHINRHGSGHSEAIVTGSTSSARAFQLGVDAACVYVNASTRFTDGGEFGMGAEIGISTQKLHVRGPIGLRELCTTKYLIEGAGHIRP